jgi:peptide deformylase
MYPYRMIKIAQREDPVLRNKARALSVEEIKSEKTKKIIADMTSALRKESDGIALAAPQIGISLQIFIISDELLALADKSYKKTGKDLVFFNPHITKLSKEKLPVEEGCLSVRWLYGITKRSTKASISYLDEDGIKRERGGSGILAQIFQHECDHLNGILFTDIAEELWEMTEEEIQEIKNKNSKQKHE